ncbi:MAG: hypothetical protein LBT89_08720 [Planctomycetaceae bacterium]|jgi:hypothetical protein|nr:hypothetical protein [Planctomycetaceae bacterium]
MLSDLRRFAMEIMSTIAAAALVLIYSLQYRHFLVEYWGSTVSVKILS